MLKTIACKDLTFRDDLYPRFEVNQSLIQRYADSIDYLPPIKVNQHNILIDGLHRWRAFQLAGRETIECEIVETESEKALKRLAYQLNSNHGLQLSRDEKRRYAQEMYGLISQGELAQVLSVNEDTITRWTKAQAEAAEIERKRLIVELYLRAWNTQKMVAKAVNLTHQAVSQIVENAKIPHLRDFCKTFVPYLYNIWNLQKQDNATDSHFGSFPVAFMRNLLHYHTEPLDIVFDPFAGGGTTVDVCKEMFRRYYCTDHNVRPGREKDIREHNILTGFPQDLPKPAMVFLDPPYWILARAEYSEDGNDLGNMTREQFYAAMNQIAQEIERRKIERIAYVMRPIWQTGSDEWEWVDPMFDLWDALNKKYCIETRYVLPYSTQQYTGLWVERAKKAGKCLILNRELTILRRR